MTVLQMTWEHRQTAMPCVDIYTRQLCCYCTMVRNLLEKKAVNYSEFRRNLFAGITP